MAFHSAILLRLDRYLVVKLPLRKPRHLSRLGLRLVPIRSQPPLRRKTSHLAAAILAVLLRVPSHSARTMRRVRRSIHRGPLRQGRSHLDRLPLRQGPVLVSVAETRRRMRTRSLLNRPVALHQAAHQRSISRFHSVPPNSLPRFPSAGVSLFLRHQLRQTCPNQRHLVDSAEEVSVPNRLRRLVVVVALHLLGDCSPSGPLLHPPGMRPEC